MQTLLEKDNITVFLPINGAFDSLPDATSAMEYLQSGEVSHGNEQIIEDTRV